MIVCSFEKVAAQHHLFGDVCCFNRGELMGPAHAMLSGGACSPVAVLAVKSGGFIRGVAPVVPPFGADHITQLALHEEHPGVGTPGAAQVEGGRCVT